jgi:hypothetical protein
MRDPEIKRIMDRLRRCPGFQECGEGLDSFLKSPASVPLTQVWFESGAFDMLQHHRKIDGRDFFWLANNTGVPQKADVFLPGLAGTVSIWDCESGSIGAVASRMDSKGLAVSLTFEALEAFWLVVDPLSPSGEMKTAAEAAGAAMVLRVPADNWHVSADPASQPRHEHPFDPANWMKQGRRMPLVTWDRWGMKSFSGFVDYEKDLRLPADADSVIIDLGTVHHMAQVWINGRDAGMRLWPPYRFDISKAVRPGVNRIKVRVGNLLNNSYGDFRPSGLAGPVTVMIR